MNQKKGYRSKYRPEYPVDFKFDYKDAASLTRFIMDAGKIVPARVSKLSSKQQNLLARAVKKARQIALVPQGTYASDMYKNPEIPQPKTFEY